uniref:C2H2-type domain-containing protein n=1 Tax=Parastrongyloides trichosuri TaxID=131310 RepID=A0A0N4ZY64_PARTI
METGKDFPNRDSLLESEKYLENEFETKSIDEISMKENEYNNNNNDKSDTVPITTTLSTTTVPSSSSSSGGSEPEQRRKKKPYKELTLEEKVQLIRLAEENSGLSQASIAERYTIAKSNVCRILQRKHEYIRAYESAGFAGSRKRKLRGDNNNHSSNENYINNPSSTSKVKLLNNLPSSSSSSYHHDNNNFDQSNFMLKTLALKNCFLSTTNGGGNGILKPIPINPFSNHLPSNNNSSTTDQHVTPNNETLRAHMYKQHQISRMFMCKCCNWAFPDKTSLHMHQQAKEEGKNVTVPVIGKGNTPTSLSAPNTSSLLGLTSSGTSLQGGNPFNSLNNLASLSTTLNLQNQLSTLNEGTNLLPQLQLLQNNEFINKFKDGLLLNNMLPHIGIQNWFAAAMSAAANTQSQQQTSNFNLLTQDGTLNQPLDLEKALQGLEESTIINNRKDDVDMLHKANGNNNNNDLGTEPELHNSASSSSAKSSPSPISIEAGTGSYFKHEDHRSNSNNTPLNITADGSDHGRQNVHSGVSPSETNSSISPSTDNGSNNNCYDCSLYKSKLAVAENRCRYLEDSMNTLQNESLRFNTRATLTESTCRQLEIDSRVIREQNEILRQKLGECQDKILSFMQTIDYQNPVSITNLLNEVIKATIIQ